MRFPWGLQASPLRCGRRQDTLSFRVDRRGTPRASKCRRKAGWPRPKNISEYELNNVSMMEDQMSDLDQHTINSPSRRGLFARFAGAAAIGVAGLKAASVRAATTADGPEW